MGSGRDRLRRRAQGRRQATHPRSAGRAAVGQDVHGLQAQSRTFAYVRRGIGRNRQRVVVTIDAAMTLLMLDPWQWLVPRLAFLDADFRVEEPAEFREALRRFGARLGRQ
ncbi:hypothetical protein SALBM311S_06321 [Streptomyces alboniger]